MQKSSMNNYFQISTVKKFKEPSLSPVSQKQSQLGMINRDSSPLRSPGGFHRQLNQQSFNNNNSNILSTSQTRNRSPIFKRQISPISQPSTGVLLKQSNNKLNLSSSFLKVPSSHQRIKSEISSSEDKKQYFFQNEDIKQHRQQFLEGNIIRKSPRTGRDYSPSSTGFKNTTTGFPAMKSQNHSQNGMNQQGDNLLFSNNNNNNNNQSVYTMVLNDEMQNNKNFFMPSKTTPQMKQNVEKLPQQQQQQNFQISSSPLSSQNLQQFLNPISQEELINISQNRSQQQQLDSFPSPQNISNNQQQQQLQYQGESSSSREKSRTSSKQLSCAHSNSTNNNTQNTQASVGSRCGNCADVEKELELLRQIVKSCSKCSQTFLSNSRPSSGTSQIFDNISVSLAEQQFFQQQQQQWQEQKYQFQQQLMQDKVMNARLQESMQVLRRQLEQVTIERDQLHHSQETENRELLEKNTKQESIIKALQGSHGRLEKKLNNFELLKSKLQESIDIIREFKENGQQIGNISDNDSYNGSNLMLGKELIAETNFLRDYLCDQQKSITEQNQRLNCIQNQRNINQNKVNSSLKTSGLSVAEITNQQLAANQQGQSLMETYQPLSSALKALQVAQQLKISTTQR